MGRRYGCRPSSFIPELNDWTAYQLDMATMLQGKWIDSRLDERDQDGNQIHKLTDLLELSTTPGDNTAPAVDNYRSLARPGLRTVKIKSDGTWD